MTLLIVAAILFAWGPLALALGLIVGPALRRSHQAELAPARSHRVRSDRALVLH